MGLIDSKHLETTLLAYWREGRAGLGWAGWCREGAGRQAVPCLHWSASGWQAGSQGQAEGEGSWLGKGEGSGLGGAEQLAWARLGEAPG